VTRTRPPTCSNVCCTRAVGERLLDRDRLVERAIRLSVSTKPSQGFAAMEPLDREAVALARLAGYSAADIAATLGVDLDEAKRSMLRCLRTAGSVVPV